MPPQLPKAKNAADDQVVIKLTVDGKVYEIRPDEISAQLVGEVRNATGMSVAAIMGTLDDGDVDIDIVTSLAFMGLRQSGDSQTKYRRLATKVTYESKIDIDVVSGDTDGGDVGEGPAAD